MSEVAQLLGYGERRTTQLISDGFMRRSRHTASYDRFAKRWISDVPSSQLHGPQSSQDAIAVLRALQVWSCGTQNAELFPIVDTRAYRQGTAADTFGILMGACARKCVVDVVYQARTRKLAVSFSPHTLVIAPGREHFRGYSVFEPEGKGHFWDLVPSRVLTAELRSKTNYIDARGDTEWHDEVILRLDLVAGLMEPMRQAIRHEHGIVGDRLEIGPIPKALLSYVRSEYIDRRYEGFADPVWKATSLPAATA